MERKMNQDTGRFEDATLEQLETFLRNIHRIPHELLDPYLQWVNGERVWGNGTAYAISASGWE